MPTRVHLDPFVTARIRIIPSQRGQRMTSSRTENDTAQRPQRSVGARILGALTGMMLGCVLTIVGAYAATALTDGEAGWVTGGLVIFYGGPIAVLGGAYFGSTPTPRTRLPDIDRTRPPAGMWRGHYPAAWLAGIATGVASSAVFFPLAQMLVKILRTYIGLLYPKAFVVAAWIFTIGAAAGMIATAFATMSLLDRWIYRARTH